MNRFFLDQLLRVPEFFGAVLHEGTVWRGVQWPTPKTAAEAGPFIDAYERLKLEMDRLKKHEDELNFFALELRSRRVMLAGLFSAVYSPLYEMLTAGSIAAFQRASAMFVAPLARAMLSA
jgi:hypothetical protein